MNWKIGQKLVCIQNTPKSWDYACPVKGEIVTCDGFDGNGMVYLVEYAALHPVGKFRFAMATFLLRPILGESAKSELVSSFKEVTETSDLPISVPQTETV